MRKFKANNRPGRRMKPAPPGSPPPGSPDRPGSNALARGQTEPGELKAVDMVAPICECCQAWIIGDGIKFADRLFCSTECLWLALEVA